MAPEPIHPEMKLKHWRGFQADNGRESARVLEFVALLTSKGLDSFGTTHLGE